jgi:hypothetical protein
VDPEMKEDMSNYSVMSNSPILRNDPLGNVDNTYEVTDGVAKKIDDKGGDEIDYVHEKTSERNTPFGVLPATERHYATPVGTTFNAGGDNYRGPGERIIGTPAFGGVEADDDILLQALPIAKVIKVAGLSMAVIFPVSVSISYLGATRKFAGGAYKLLGRKAGQIERNHIPSMDAYSRAGAKISKQDAPAIEMIYEEHRKFISTGRGRAAEAFRKTEGELLSQGKYNEAFDLNANFIRSSYGDKYNDAIEQARSIYIEKIIPALRGSK